MGAGAGVAARTCAQALADIGALAIPRAIDARGCARLIADMRSSPASATRPISGETMLREYDPDFARSQTVRPSAFAQELLEGVLGGHRAALEAFFAQPLELSPELHLLIYERGGFILPHCDVMDGDGVLEKIRERVVLFTLMLNGPRARAQDSVGGAEPDGFEGGEFVLHPTSEQRFALTCAPGTLLAFRAELVHSVREITAGTRYSVAGWFRRGHERR